MNKRGLSPIAATMVLLLSAIAIGVVAMSLGRVYVQEAGNEEAIAANSPIIIEIGQLDDPLKHIQVDYIIDKISKDEYLEKEKEILAR